MKQLSQSLPLIKSAISQSGVLIRQNYRRTLLLGIVALCIGVLLVFGAQSATAQSQAIDWGTPVNLSESGGAADPKIVQSSDGKYHIFWLDTYAGIVYASGDGQNWSAPSAGEFPFSEVENIPSFVADQSGYIHAFWYGEEDELFYSRVSASEAGNPLAWSASLQLAEASLDFDLTIDDQDVIHLLYVRPLDSTDFPSGVYYRQSRDNGSNWSGGQSLYATKYFRSLILGETNLDITADGANIYAVWDHRPLRRVFFAASTNRGSNWDAPFEIDGPSQNASDNLPYNIQVSGANGQVLVVWQVGQPQFNCSQHYRTSSNLGQEWSPINRMLRNTAGCPISNQFLGTLDADPDVILLATNILQQYYLSGWDGEKWSDLILQAGISTFTDQNTLNTVEMRCLDLLKTDNNLLAVGCDTGTGKDIWLLQRTIGGVEEWFPPLTSWSSPALITSNEFLIVNPIAVSDQTGSVHAVWIQEQSERAATSGLGGSVPASIYYSRWDGSAWLRPAEIIKPLDGRAGSLSVDIDLQGRLHLVWIGGQSGQVFYSWNTIEDASSAALWNTPIVIPAPRPIAASPEIKVDQQGIIHVVSVFPLNELRGIQYNRSEDQGKTWSDPVLVFDAGTAGWDQIDSPHLAVAADGSLHAIFTRFSLLTQASQGIYYSSSSDLGLTWSAPEQLSESPVVWSSLVNSGANTIHRFWESLDDQNLNITHEYSQDNGLTWIRSSALPGTAQLTGPVGFSQSPAGRIHLLAGSRGNQGADEIQYWVWDSGNWFSESALSLQLSDIALKYLRFLPVASTSKSQLILLYLGQTASNIVDQGQLITLSSVFRGTTEDTSSPLPLVSSTATPISIQANTPTPPGSEPTPSPTPDLSALINQGGQSGLFSNQYASMILGAGLSILLVAAVIFLKFRPKLRP